MNSDFSALSQDERELRLTALALGELAPAEAEEIRRAIAADAELARAFERLKQTVALVRETAAMDRKVSPEGAPLRLDEGRRNKLLETFQSPAPAAVKLRRRRNLWFVPMSAAALLIGLLVVSVTELSNIGPWKKAREMAQRSSFNGLSDGGTKPYVTGADFSELGNESEKEQIVLREVRGGSPAVDFAKHDFDADDSVPAALQRQPPSQPANPVAKISRPSSIALPAVTTSDGNSGFQGSGQWTVNGNAVGNSYSGQHREQPSQPSPPMAETVDIFRYSVAANSSGSMVPSAPTADAVASVEGFKKGIVWEESKNLDAQAKSELPAAAIRGQKFHLSDVDTLQTGLRDTKDAPARNLYLGSEPVATSTPVAEQPWDKANASLGFGIGGSGDGTFAQSSIAGGRGGNGQGNKNAEPARPFARGPSGVIDSVSLPAETEAVISTPAISDRNFRDTGNRSHQSGVDRKAYYEQEARVPGVAGREFLLEQETSTDSRVPGFDSPPGNVALKNQSREQSVAVRSTNLAKLYQESFMDDAASEYVNGATVRVTNGLMSNDSWPGASTTNHYFALNDSSWFGKDGSEKSRADSYAVAGQERIPGKAPPAQYSYSTGNGSESPSLNYRWKMNSGSLAQSGQGVEPSSAGQSQPSGDHAGVRMGFDGRLNSGVSQSAGAGGFNVGYDALASASGKGDQPARAASGRVDIQLPTSANEPQVNRRSGLERSLGEKASVDYSGPVNVVVESLLGVDAEGLPIEDLEAKEGEKVNLNYGGVAAGGDLDTQVLPEARNPIFRITPGMGAPVSSGSTLTNLFAGDNVKTGIEVTNPSRPAMGVRFAKIASGSIVTNFVTAGAGDKSRAAVKVLEDGATRPQPSPSSPAPQPEVLTRDNAFSTFSLNVSDVSFKLAAASLEKGAMPEAANIRSEEFINAFDYRDPMPVQGAPIAFTSERARYPFAHNRDVVRFSVKTAAQGREAGKPLNIVLLLDNSGSMERADRVRIIQESLRSLTAQLKPQDKISVVTFSRTARLWADGVTGAQAAEVANKIGALTPEGGTNLEDALDLAYRTALRHYAATAVNRVVLLTDGAANLGNVEPKELKAKVESFRKQGIALDCFGIGWEGFNDDLLEQLSRNGDGRYGFVNTPEEAASEFVGQLAGALRVAASDVKVQVEFNPKRVTAYRQIGYAKHQLTKEQFRDNKVDAAEIGAAESGNALYVIETNPNGQGPIATVRARFRVPQTSDYREHEWVVPFGSAVELEQSSGALRLATSASAFSEWLAGSPFAGDVTTDRLLGLLSGVPEVYGADPRPKKLEWMIRQAKSISGK